MLKGREIDQPIRDALRARIFLQALADVYDHRVKHGDGDDDDTVVAARLRDIARLIPRRSILRRILAPMG